MKLKKEFIVLGIIIILLGGYLIFHNPDRSRYTLPVIPKIDQKQISKLEIRQAGKTITLTLKDSTWYIEPKQYPADPEKITPMLNALEGLTLTAMVSESESYSRYGLDNDEKITVKAWDGGDLKRELDIGQTAATYRHTFVKLPNDPHVYHGRGSFRYQFENDVEALRNKLVLSFNTADIQEMTIKAGDQTIDIKQVKTDDAAPTWQAADGRPVDTAHVQNLLSALSSYRCQGFIEDKAKTDFKDPLYEIGLSGTQSYTFSIYPPQKKDDDDRPGTTSQNDYPFLLSGSQVDYLKTEIEKILKGEETTPAEEKSADAAQ